MTKPLTLQTNKTEMRKYLNRFLIRLLPKRMRKKLLVEVMETDQEYGLYDETFKIKQK